MAEVAIKSPLQYLDKASSALREMGLMPEKVDPAPINALLEKISDLDQDKIALIARTLGQADVFNEVVREQTSKMEIGERYQAITKRLQLYPRRLQAPGRSSRRWQDRYPRTRHQHVDEDSARRHRRPLRQDPQNLLVRHQGDQESDRARGQDPRRLSRLPWRLEARRGDGAGGAQKGRTRSSMRRRRISRPRPTRSPHSRALSLPNEPSWSWRATRSCVAPRTRTSATRSPRTCRTT